LQKETSTWGKIMWAFPGKKRAETVLLELRWFVDRLHELVPTSGRVGLDLTNVIRRAMILLAVRVLTPGIDQAMALTGTITPLSGALNPLDTLFELARIVIANTLRMTKQSSAISDRVENRRLQSHIRRARLKHARTTAAGAASKIESKIRANER
jgi:hypothetical protein